jgi:hypothetical protein
MIFCSPQIRMPTTGLEPRPQLITLADATIIIIIFTIPPPPSLLLLLPLN